MIKHNQSDWKKNQSRQYKTNLAGYKFTTFLLLAVVIILLTNI